MRNSGTEAHIKVVHVFYVRLCPRFPCGAITSHFFSVIFLFLTRFLATNNCVPSNILQEFTNALEANIHSHSRNTRSSSSKNELVKKLKNVLSTMNIKLWNEWVSCLGDQTRKSLWTKLHDILFSILANKVYNLNTKILTLRWIVVQSNLYWAVLY